MASPADGRVTLKGWGHRGWSTFPKGSMKGADSYKYFRGFGGHMASVNPLSSAIVEGKQL